MTSGLQQVCKLWFWVSKSMLPVRHLAPKILMAVNYCGHQLARRFGWVVHAYHKKEGASPHPGVCKHSYQYDRRPDGCFVVWVVMWNLGSLSGKGSEVCDELRKRMIDVCCLWDVRWKGQSVRMLGMEGRRYKLWWSGKGDEVGGVVVMVKEELYEKVVEVRRASNWVMTVVVLEEDVLRFICGYVP